VCGAIRVDEVIWVKNNQICHFRCFLSITAYRTISYTQLQRVIRTGRTGHWLNHTNEHMLVGVKTNYDSNGNLKFLHGSIATWIWTSSCQKFVRRVANQMKFMGSSSECAPAGARSKYSVESTARGQGGVSPTYRDGDAKILKVADLGESVRERLVIPGRFGYEDYGHGLYTTVGLNSDVGLDPSVNFLTTLPCLLYFNLRLLPGLHSLKRFHRSQLCSQ